jgi:hypothetical protein
MKVGRLVGSLKGGHTGVDGILNWIFDMKQKSKARERSRQEKRVRKDVIQKGGRTRAR